MQQKQSSVLEINGLRKSYGKIIALNGVSLTVPQGSIYGILGPNGSGKTTLLSLILDVLKPDAGSYSWFNEPGSPSQRKMIGSLLETPNFYHYLSAVDNLKITHNISGRGDEADIDRVLEIVKLSHRKKSSFSSYSLGMKQRLAIAGSLLGNPDVLVLDEPTNGLDPVGIAEIRELIKKLSATGKTIIMASHLLDEVEKLCTHAAILKHGDVITAGHVNEVLFNESLVEVSCSNNQLLKELLLKSPFIHSIGVTGEVLQLGTDASFDLAELNSFCFANGVTLTHLLRKKKSLETRFFELTNNPS